MLPEPTDGAGLKPERLLTVKQVAELLGVSRATVYRLVSEGSLPHLRVLNSIRVPSSGLAAAMQPGGALASQAGPA